MTDTVGKNFGVPQTFAIYNASTFPDQALALRLQKHWPLPSKTLFLDAMNLTHTVLPQPK
jgi:hypothetical protein